MRLCVCAFTYMFRSAPPSLHSTQRCNRFGDHRTRFCRLRLWRSPAMSARPAKSKRTSAPPAETARETTPQRSAAEDSPPTAAPANGRQPCPRSGTHACSLFLSSLSSLSVSPSLSLSVSRSPSPSLSVSPSLSLSPSFRDCPLSPQRIKEARAVPPSEIPCGPNCENRSMYLECSARSCVNGKDCTNRRFQRRQYAKCHIEYMGSKGASHPPTHPLRVCVCFGAQRGRERQERGRERGEGERGREREEREREYAKCVLVSCGSARVLSSENKMGRMSAYLSVVVRWNGGEAGAWWRPKPSPPARWSWSTAERSFRTRK